MKLNLKKILIFVLTWVLTFGAIYVPMHATELDNKDAINTLKEEDITVNSSDVSENNEDEIITDDTDDETVNDAEFTSDSKNDEITEEELPAITEEEPMRLMSSGTENPDDDYQPNKTDGSYYCAEDEGYMSDWRKQDDANCWCYAAVNQAETYARKFRLNETSLDADASYNAATAGGGYDTLKGLWKWPIATDGTKLHLSGTISVDTGIESPSASDINLMKNLIKKYGSATILYHNQGVGNIYYTSLLDETHVLECVGYDDNYPAERFSDYETGKHPSNNGAFILKDSNTLDRNHNNYGFRYMSYETNIVRFTIDIYDNSNKYDNIYSPTTNFYEVKSHKVTKDETLKGLKLSTISTRLSTMDDRTYNIYVNGELAKSVTINLKNNDINEYIYDASDSTVYATDIIYPIGDVELKEGDILDIDVSDISAFVTCDADSDADSDAVTSLESASVSFPETCEFRKHLSYLTPSVKLDGKTLYKGTDYTISYEGETSKCGTIKATITGIGKYTGTATGSYEIVKSNIFWAVCDYNKTEEYPTAYQMPKNVRLNGQYLVKDVDYTVTFEGDYTEVGNIRITITGIGNYTGSRDYIYEVTKVEDSSNNFSKASVSDFEINLNNGTYTGNKVPATGVVKFKGTVLKEGTDFEYNYISTVDYTTAGWKNIQIKGIGKYTGIYGNTPEDVEKADWNSAKDITYCISSVDAFNADIKVTVADSVRTSKDQVLTPDITVTFNGKTLVKDKDYGIEVPDTITNGENYITVTFQGYGSKSITGQLYAAWNVTDSFEEPTPTEPEEPTPTEPEKTKHQINVSVTAGDTTCVSEAAKTSGTYSVENSNPLVAVFSNDGTIKGKKAGNTVITVTMEADIYEISVEVLEKSKPETPVDNRERITLDDVTLGIGGNITISELTYNDGDDMYKVSYSKKGIASLGKNGEIVGKKKGSVKITVSTSFAVYTVNVTVTTPKLKKTSVSLNTGDTLSENFITANVDTIYSSSKSSVAEVDDNGCIRAVGKGSAKITAKAGGKKYTCTVNVYDPYLSGTDNILANKKAYTLSVKSGKGKTTWSSSDTSVLTIKGGKIKGISAGTATVTAVNNGRTLTKEIRVYDVPKFTAKTYTVNAGDSLNLTEIFNSQGMEGTVYSLTKKTKAASLDGNTVTALKAGNCTITAKVGGKNYSAKLKVYNPTIAGKKTVKVNKTVKLSIKSGCGKTQWSSSDEAIVTVKNGTIKGISEGTATITAVNNGKTVTTEITATR